MDLSEQLSDRDRHIASLEARLASVPAAVSPPLPNHPLSPVASRLSISSDTSAASGIDPAQFQATTERAKLLQEKLGRAVAHLKRLTEENARLSTRIGELESENDELKEKTGPGSPVVGRSDYEFVKGYAAQLEASIQEVTQQDEVLKAKVEDLERNLEKFQKGEVGSADEVEKLKAAVADLEGKLRDAQTGRRCEHFQEDFDPSMALQGLNQSIFERETSIEKLTASIGDTNAERATMTPDLDRFRNEGDEKSQQIQKLQSNLAELTREKTDVETELAKIRDISEAREREILRIQSEGSTLRRVLEDMQRALDARSIEIEAAERRKHEIDTIYSQKLKEIAAVHGEIDSLKESLLEREAEIETLTNAVVERGELEKERADVASTNDELVRNALQRVLSSLLSGERNVELPEANLAQELVQQICDRLKSSDELSASLEELQKRLAEAQADAQDARSSLESEQNSWVEQLSGVKKAVAAKLQAEMASSQQLREELEQQTNENNSLRSELERVAREQSGAHTAHSQHNALVSRLKAELAAQSETFSTRFTELTNEVARKSARVEELTRHLVESEESFSVESTRVNDEMAAEVSRREKAEMRLKEMELAIVEAEQRSADSDVELEDMRSKVRSIEGDLEKVKGEKRVVEVSLANLQGVLEQFQASKDQEIEFALEGVQRQLTTTQTALDEYKERARVAEDRLSRIGLDVSSASQLQQELSEKNATIGKLRHDVIKLQSHLAEAMRQLRDLSGTTDNVDRKLITNLVVSFCSASRGDKTKFEILSVISSILKFTEEEKVKVGLIRKAWSLLPSSAPPPEPSISESFSDLWISFLLKESNANAPPQEGGSSTSSITSRPSSQVLFDASSYRGSSHANDPQSPTTPTSVTSGTSSFGFGSSAGGKAGEAGVSGSLLERILGEKPTEGK
ncbi:hypothetical protein BJ742DRAFT_766470 [Cladochytrium replicatum]|nr:hypothetical protein BJ742DRAFT_766470 [Cladochytrium replicatum]